MNPNRGKRRASHSLKREILSRQFENRLIISRNQPTPRAWILALLATLRITKGRGERGEVIFYERKKNYYRSEVEENVATQLPVNLDLLRS